VTTTQYSFTQDKAIKILMWQKKTIKINKEGSKRTEGRGEK
jgi:hypothetical protein